MIPAYGLRLFWGGFHLPVMDAGLFDLLEHLPHHPVDQVDGFERTEHDLEIGDSSILAPGDHVHTIDGDPLNDGLKFQNGIVAGDDLPQIAEGRRCSERAVPQSDTMR